MILGMLLSMLIVCYILGQWVWDTVLLKDWDDWSVCIRAAWVQDKLPLGDNKGYWTELNISLLGVIQRGLRVTLKTLLCVWMLMFRCSVTVSLYFLWESNTITRRCYLRKALEIDIQTHSVKTWSGKIRVWDPHKHLSHHTSKIRLLFSYQLF